MSIYRNPKGWGFSSTVKRSDVVFVQVAAFQIAVFNSSDVPEEGFVFGPNKLFAARSIGVGRNDKSFWEVGNDVMLLGCLEPWFLQILIWVVGMKGASR